MGIATNETRLVHKNKALESKAGVTIKTDLLTRLIELLTGGEWTRVEVTDGRTVLQQYKKNTDNERLVATLESEFIPRESQKHDAVSLPATWCLPVVKLTLEGKSLYISADEYGRWMVRVKGEKWQYVSTHNEGLVRRAIEAVYGEGWSDKYLRPIDAADRAKQQAWADHATGLGIAGMYQVVAGRRSPEVRYMEALDKTHAKVAANECYEEAGPEDYAADVLRSLDNKIIVDGEVLTPLTKETYINTIVKPDSSRRRHAIMTTEPDGEKKHNLFKVLTREYGVDKGIKLYNTLIHEATIKSFSIGVHQGTYSHGYNDMVTRIKYDRNDDTMKAHPGRELKGGGSEVYLMTNGSDLRTTVINTEKANGEINAVTTETTLIYGCCEYPNDLQREIQEGDKLRIGLARATISTKVTSTDASGCSLENTKITRNAWSTALSATELAAVV